jgi:hypothetical protein
MDCRRAWAYTSGNTEVCEQAVLLRLKRYPYFLLGVIESRGLCMSDTALVCASNFTWEFQWCVQDPDVSVCITCWGGNSAVGVGGTQGGFA